MFGLISGTVFRDVEIKNSKAGKPYARATVKDEFAEDATFLSRSMLLMAQRPSRCFAKLARTTRSPLRDG